MSLSGRFVWRELVTPEPAAAAAFYGKVFGWSATTMPMGGTATYTMLRLDGRDVAGAMRPTMDGVPPFWLDYITVDDVDATLAAIPGLGGQVLVPATDFPGVGRFGICKDPTGAVFAAFRGNNPGMTDTESTPPVGTFCWSQLMTSDVDRAVAFYGKVFGWSAAPRGGVTVMSTGENMRCTVMAKPAAVHMPDHWVQYVAVDDADAMFAKAVAAGATPYQTPIDMQGMGRFGVLGDPAGAVFALWKQAVKESA